MSRYLKSKPDFVNEGVETDKKWKESLLKLVLEDKYSSVSNLKSIFKCTFDFDYKRETKLKNFFGKRNDLAHRNGLTCNLQSENREKIIVTIDMLKDFVNRVSSHVDDIIAGIYYKVHPRAKVR